MERKGTKGFGKVVEGLAIAEDFSNSSGATAIE